MSHTNSTPNYNLPQFLTTDKPFWLTDINGAFSAIDTGINAAKDAADNAQGDATQALTDAGNASTAASTADAKASGAISSIADTYDATATYALNDLVMYNSLLYKNIVAIVTPEAWDGSHWTRVTIEDIKQNATDSALNTTNKTVTGAINELNTEISTLNIVSVTRVATSVTTGNTGNVALPYDNDGKTFIVGAISTSADYAATIWVSSQNNGWYLTFRGAGTWTTVNNQTIDIRYWVVKTKNA